MTLNPRKSEPLSLTDDDDIVVLRTAPPLAPGARALAAEAADDRPATLEEATTLDWSAVAPAEVADA